MSSKFDSVADARYYYFRNWSSLKKRNATFFRKDAKIGSCSTWKQFVKAMNKYRYHRLYHDHKKSLELTSETYPNVRLVPPKSWNATSGTPGLRKGPTEHFTARKLKTGPNLARKL